MKRSYKILIIVSLVSLLAAIGMCLIDYGRQVGPLLVFFFGINGQGS